jgi:dihydrodipicolinate synthase/N-acetylneuraminate lyase
MALPSGAYAPVPTPLDDRGLLDPTALERHLGFLAAEGLDGALILGTNGEFPSFDVSERLALAEAAARSGHGLSLMLGVGSSALPEVIQLVQAARHFGYQSALAPPPFYFRSAPTEGLIAFFRAVLDAAEIPVLLYHIPQVTGIEISDAILASVGDHPRFGGVKDSSGRESELERFIAGLGGRSTMVGNDRLISRAVAAGGSGSITASASVAPALVAAARRDSGRQGELDSVRILLENYGLGPAVKAILRHRGFGAYRTRPPLVDLDEAAAAKLIAEFENLTKT